MHILVAEDNPTNANMIRQILGKLDHSTELAEDGLIALELLRSGSLFDFVLMDIQMPNLNGLDTSRRMLEEFDSPPPVVAFTANAFDSDRQAAKEAGMVGFLPKPVTLKALKEILNDIDNHESKPPSKDSSIDWEYVDTITDGGTDDETAQIFEDFCYDFPNKMEELESTQSSNDWSAFAKVAHQLKGTFGLFGLISLSQNMGKLEKGALEGDINLSPNWASELKNKFAKDRESLEAYLLNP